MVDGEEPASLEPTLYFPGCQLPVYLTLLVDLEEGHWQARKDGESG